MNVSVNGLQPGDIVSMAGLSATFVQQAEHPIWPGLQLVIWRLPDGSWSHDALDPRQVVGERVEQSDEQRHESLRLALLGAAR